MNDDRADNDESRIRYGGGHQEGGGMIEPDEFADGGTDVLDTEPDHGSAQAVENAEEPAEERAERGAGPPR